jgi:hypothetical protein
VGGRGGSGSAGLGEEAEREVGGGRLHEGDEFVLEQVVVLLEEAVGGVRHGRAEVHHGEALALLEEPALAPLVARDEAARDAHRREPLQLHVRLVHEGLVRRLRVALVVEQRELRAGRAA